MSFRTRLVLVVVLVTGVTGISAWGFGQSRPQPVNPVVILETTSVFALPATRPTAPAAMWLSVRSLCGSTDNGWERN